MPEVEGAVLDGMVDAPANRERAVVDLAVPVEAGWAQAAERLSGESAGPVEGYEEIVGLVGDRGELGGALALARLSADHLRDPVPFGAGDVDGHDGERVRDVVVDVGVDGPPVQAVGVEPGEGGGYLTAEVVEHVEVVPQFGVHATDLTEQMAAATTNLSLHPDTDREDGDDPETGERHADESCLEASGSRRVGE